MSLKNINILDLHLHDGQTVFANEEILEVFYDLLENSKSWDLGLGFFRFSGFRQLAMPLSKFLINGGKIRIYSNEKLSENDYNIAVSSYVEQEDTREVINITELNSKINKKS